MTTSEAPPDLDREQLAEALIDLQRALHRERELRQQLETLLDGVGPLTQPMPNATAIFDRLLDVARPLLAFDHAAILEPEPGTTDTLLGTVATVPSLQGRRWEVGDTFRRILDGRRPVASFDLRRIPEWKPIAPVVGDQLSALHLPISRPGAAAMLVCTHATRGFFTHRHVSIATRLVPLASQALVNIEKVEASVRAAREKSDLLSHATRALGIGAGSWDPSAGQWSRTSVTLQDLARAWPSIDAWWADAVIAGGLPAHAPCPRCGAPQRTGKRTADLRAPGGTRQVFEITCTGHAHDLGLRDHEVVLVADVTGWVTTQEHLSAVIAELEHARDAALQASRTKSTFLANMSHELRTPLNAILGYTELVRETLPADESHDVIQADLARISSAGTHLLGLIAGVLDLAKIEAGKVSPVVQSFEIARWLDELEAAARPLMVPGGNRFVVERHVPAGLVWHTDALRALQILLNLLSNAAKFTRHGEIRLVVRQTVADLQFEVHDTGIGIEQTQFERIFGAFEQVDESSTRRTSGTGLGLAITRHLCRMLGGDVSVRSEIGCGSVFVAILARDLRDSSASDGTEPSVPHERTAPR